MLLYIITLFISTCSRMRVQDVKPPTNTECFIAARGVRTVVQIHCGLGGGFGKHLPDYTT